MLQLTRWRILNQIKKRERDNGGQESRLSGPGETPDLPLTKPFFY